MSVYKRGEIWWYRFKWSGESIRESTKQGNRRTAETIEAARKTELAKSDVGIKDRKRTPTLAEFAEQTFLPFVEKQKAGKPRTIRFYQDRIACLRMFPRLWRTRLDLIEPQAITSYIGSRQTEGMETSTINCDLASTGHIDISSLKKQHAAALKASGVDPFVVYSLRHTCLTRWAESGIDVFTLKRLAGHANIQTTMRYVHMSGARDRAAMEKVWRGHKSSTMAKNEPIPISAGLDVKTLKSAI